MLYEHIKTTDQLSEFVEKLNSLPLYDRYMLFQHVFDTRVHELRPLNFPVTGNSHYQKWWFNVGDFAVFSTVKINKRNFIENPDIQTGFYENIYYHLNPDDTQA